MARDGYIPLMERFLLGCCAIKTDAKARQRKIEIVFFILLY
jgi:hypothetical protein